MRVELLRGEMILSLTCSKKKKHEKKNPFFKLNIIMYTSARLHVYVNVNARVTTLYKVHD